MLSENILWLGLVESMLIHHERHHPDNHKGVRLDVGMINELIGLKDNPKFPSLYVKLVLTKYPI